MITIKRCRLCDAPNDDGGDYCPSCLSDANINRIIKMFRSPTAEMRVDCAWCKRVIRPSVPGAKVSHGICHECLSKVTFGEDTVAVPMG